MQQPASMEKRSVCCSDFDRISMIFVLDNYDSFTYNLVQRLGEIDGSLDIRVARNDCISIGEIEALKPERIIVSPGPCTPAEAGISKELVAHFASRLPILGVCLGHQSIAEVMGAKVDVHALERASADPDAQVTEAVAKALAAIAKRGL